IPEIGIGLYIFKFRSCQVLTVSTYAARSDFDTNWDAGGSELLQSRSLHKSDFGSPSTIATIDLPDSRVEIGPVVEMVETCLNVSINDDEIRWRLIVEVARQLIRRDDEFAICREWLSQENGQIR